MFIWNIIEWFGGSLNLHPLKPARFQIIPLDCHQIEFPWRSHPEGINKVKTKSYFFKSELQKQLADFIDGVWRARSRSCSRQQRAAALSHWSLPWRWPHLSLPPKEVLLISPPDWPSRVVPPRNVSAFQSFDNPPSSSETGAETCFFVFCFSSPLYFNLKSTYVVAQCSFLSSLSSLVFRGGSRWFSLPGDSTSALGAPGTARVAGGAPHADVGLCRKTSFGKTQT